MKKSKMTGEVEETPQQKPIEIPGLDSVLGSKRKFDLETTTNFLPKFDNQNEDKKLAGLMSSDQGTILYVSKKHSGSLLMAPPFYSKNGTGNEFSRVGCVLLYEYFEAVWPGEGKAKFMEWWDDAERTGICYAFECVTPRILGDHGATPKGAYVVLTCASWTMEGRFLSPSELLQVATKWHLPLNEVWMFPGTLSRTIERELHERRWTMQDKDASEILDKYLENGTEVQRFLPHADTQGQVLEGFVLMALEADLQVMSGLVKEYNDTMRQYYASALETALRLGDMCLDPKRGKGFLKAIHDLAVAPLNLKDVYSEPQKLKRHLSDKAVWDLVLEKTNPSPTKKALKRLRDMYGHVTVLVPYFYKGNVQVQVHVRQDEVFYGWPLHMMDKSTGPLYRGMVVTMFQDKRPRVNSPSGEQTARVNIIGIAKLKCLNYMWRTFGVRNRLTILLNRGKSDYLKTLKKGFYPPWRIPKEYIPKLDRFFSKWADFALSLPKPDQKKLTNAYLSCVEEFLTQNPFPLIEPENGAVTPPQPPQKKQLSVTILNLTGTSLCEDDFVKLGCEPKSNVFKAGDIAGFYEVCTRCPRIEKVTSSIDLLIVLSLEYNNRMKRDTSGLSAETSKAMAGSYKSLKKKVFPKLRSKCSVVIVRDPASTDVIIQEVVNTGRKDSTEMETEENAQSDDNSSKPKRLVIFAAGLPPGGGKSSLFDAFATLTSSKGNSNVSYCFRSSDDFKGRQPFENQFVRCVQGHKGNGSKKGEPNPKSEVIVVGYDKNVPNMDGIKRLLSVLKPETKKYDIRFLIIVPENLDHDAFWARVKMRDYKTHIGLAISPKLSEKEAYKIFKNFFYDPCEEFNPVVAKAPGALESGIFTETVVEGSNPLLPLAESCYGTIETFKAGCSYRELNAWCDDNDTLLSPDVVINGNRKTAPEKADWCCADVDGHRNLHVTLVPPSSDASDRKNPQRKATLKALQTIAGRGVKVKATKYHIATLQEEQVGTGATSSSRKRSNSSTAKDRRNVKRIAFWEVDEVDGLPDGVDLGEQFEILHITDRASMTKGVKAKCAGEVLRELRQKETTEKTKWSVQTETHPIDLSARISFYG
mmetsp:Transcript_20022/g.43266  ORF Transcript_20022/g.43266 Transcript_20022/m.43266 type:complete len:1095 (-) Transcript_20022:608-3892(-)